jgi:hypothetical protein
MSPTKKDKAILLTTDEPLNGLKSKLEELNNKLQELAQSASEDIELATALQKILYPNRLEQIPGIRCFSRFIRGAETGTEGFDLFTETPKKSGSWFVASQTETFGLSSVLMQTLIYLSTRLTRGQEKNLSPREFFNLLSESMMTAKKSGKFRLLVAYFNHHTLKWNGVSTGYPPFLVRERIKTKLSAWNFEPGFLNSLKQNPKCFEAHLNSKVPNEESTIEFYFQMSPGSRLSFLSPNWAGAENFNDYQKRFEVLRKNSKHLAEEVGVEQDMIDDLNEFLSLTEKLSHQEKRKVDITSLVWDIDHTKLHIAV